MTRRQIFVIAVVWLLASHATAFLPFQSKARGLVRHNYDPFLIPTDDIQRLVTNQPNGIPLSTSELLAELDARNIRYPPTATRKDLEKLLDTREDDQTKKNSDAPSKAPEEALTDTKDVSQVQSPPAEAPPTDLSTIVQELVAQCVQIPRYASRSDLERLWLEQKQKPPAVKQPRKQHTEIPRILKELDELGIPYPPGASLKMLQQLLINYEEEETPQPARLGRPAQSSRQRDTTPNSSRRGTSELLDELMRRNVRFLPTATRQELEELLQKTEGVGSERTELAAKKVTWEDEGEVVQPTGPRNDVRDDAIVDDTLVNPDAPPLKDGKEEEMETEPDLPIRDFATNDRNTRFDTESPRRESPARGPAKQARGASRQRTQYTPRRSRLNKKTKQAIWTGVSQKFNGATTRLSRVAERAARKARYATRTAKDFLAEDENGIRDADYEYVNKQNVVIIDVPSESTDEEQERPYEREQSAYRSSASGQRWRRPSTTAAHTVRKRRPRRRTEEIQAQPLANVAARSRLFRLPPAEGTADQSERSKRQRRRHNSASDASRRIYSPYDEGGVPGEVYRDSIDKVGEFFTRATDALLWGGSDEEEAYEKGNSRPSKTKTKKRKRRSDPADREDVHWRDRMEERFDSMLGIHEEGDYYNRWTEQEEKEDREAGGTDAFSVAQGRAPKRRHHRRPRRNKVYDKPFWDQENFISSLFGRVPPDGYSNAGPGNLLPFLKTTIRSLISFAANACAWGSVRGSLPQPVVVVGVTSCALCARPGQRILATALSLVAFRIVGELVHEGLYGDEDWEDDEDDEEVEPANDDDWEGEQS